MRKPISLVAILIFSIVILSFVQVAISTRLSTTGIELSKIQEEIKQYKKKNALLSEKLLLQTSLTQIASRASELGFEDPKSQIYIAPLPVAKR